MAMVASFEPSPMPNQMMNSGSSAILGIGNSAETMARPTERATEASPIANPSAAPSVVPIASPPMRRNSEAETCSHMAPLAVSRHSAAPTSDGLGMISGCNSPVEEASCQTVTRTTRAIAPTDGAGGRLEHAAAIGDLAAGAAASG